MRELGSIAAPVSFMSSVPATPSTSATVSHRPDGQSERATTESVSFLLPTEVQSSVQPEPVKQIGRAHV